MQLQNNQWHFGIHSVNQDEIDALDCLQLQNTISNPGRYVKSLQFGYAQKHCKVIITPKSGGVGCRIVGNVLDRLAIHYRDVDQIPRRIYLQAIGGPFQLRGLLTLSYLSSPKSRRAMFQNYTWHHFPSDGLEKPADYEARVVDGLHIRFQGYEKLRPTQLQLKGILSNPDGLFLNRDDGELMIIEAKMNKADFSDGTAQLIQYYSQAKNHAIFQGLTMKTCLVTSINEETPGYNVWKRLMSSEKELQFFVDDVSVPKRNYCIFTQAV